MFLFNNNNFCNITIIASKNNFFTFWGLVDEFSHDNFRILFSIKYLIYFGTFDLRELRAQYYIKSITTTTKA